MARLRPCSNKSQIGPRNSCSRYSGLLPAVRLRIREHPNSERIVRNRGGEESLFFQHQRAGRSIECAADEHAAEKGRIRRGRYIRREAGTIGGFVRQHAVGVDNVRINALFAFQVRAGMKRLHAAIDVSRVFARQKEKSRAFTRDLECRIKAERFYFSVCGSSKFLIGDISQNVTVLIYRADENIVAAALFEPAMRKLQGRLKGKAELRDRQRRTGDAQGQW